MYNCSTLVYTTLVPPIIIFPTLASESSNLRQLLGEELNAITKQLKEHKKYSKSEVNDKTIKSIVNKYVLLKQSYKSYMEYCEVYQLVQQSLIDKKKIEMIQEKM